MYHRIIPPLLAVLLLAGCATERQQRAATTGAVVGATAGAVIGAQSDRTVEGAVIGGIIGGLAGAVLADDGSDNVYESEPRYHRKSCGRGEPYFRDARREKNPHRRAELLREGLHYCPNNPAAHNDLGVALVIIGRDAEARQHFNHALRLDPNYLPARRNIEHMDRQRPQYREEQRYDRGRHEGYDRREQNMERRDNRREKDRRDNRRNKDRYDD